MEAISRKPLQGITNIIRFNWHFYLVAAAFVALLLLARAYGTDAMDIYLSLGILLTLAGTTLSLAVSFYVYDCSGLYRLHWLNYVSVPTDARLVNIHAGFDETSVLLAQKYPSATLQVLDFYNPLYHTEVSIRRARKAYPSYPGTRTVSTTDPALEKHSTDCIFAILAVHEIRNRHERIAFFRALRESLKEEGQIVVVEHLRDLPNFVAYTIGFIHFFSKREWRHTFQSAGLHIVQQFPITPFIRAFILQKDGTTP